MNKITQEMAEKLIKSTNGRIFSAIFTKKDGSDRKMVCRLGVTKHLKGGEQSFEPADFDMITVFDVQKKGYRMVRVDTLKSVSVDGEEFEVV
jgi:hypothetical protein